MKLVTFKVSCIERIGVLLNDEKVLDLNMAYQKQLEKDGELDYKTVADALLPSDMVGLLRRGDKGLELAVEVLENADLEDKYIYNLNEVELMSPILNPEKIICLSHNYSDFLEITKVPVPPVPRIFSKYNNAICGPYDDIIKPKASNELGYEAELAFVMGKTARNVKAEDAYDYIAGYTIFNDVSASDVTATDTQVLRGKTFDTFAPMGPYLITKDEVEDPHNLTIKCWVNDNMLQDENTSSIYYQIPELVEFISSMFPLKPGDVIATGTPYGIAKYLPNPVYMVEGDVCTVEIEKLGKIVNKIVDEK
ncbi:MAG: fumarylacetoacetate hydrolase family protein [Gudongella sp.]|nr:fumarylacetoacetate hydrolase family protein [Gudongella sp.]